MKVQPLVALIRGQQIESIHSGAVAICDPAGRLKAAIGDPGLMTYLRSVAKPLQALPFLETGAADAIGASAKELAVVCASHTGTDEHAQLVASLLSKSGASGEDLQCGTHSPFDKETAERLRRKNEPASALRNNCSGKHAGMLATARHQGESTADYLAQDHPLQQRIIHAFCQVTGCDRSTLEIGIDGCSAPIFAVPLGSLATAYARLADPSQLPPGRRQALERIYQAMTAQPWIVAGEGEFDSKLMEAANGSILAKSGAEGVMALALSPTDGRPALGIAIKIADGDPRQRAKPLVALHLLDQLALVDPTVVGAVRKWVDTLVTNRKGEAVGELKFIGELDERAR